MDLQVASQWATLVATGLLVIAPLLGMLVWWWQRRKQNQRTEKALRSVKAVSDQGKELMRRAFTADLDKLSELKQVQLQLANLHDTLGDIYTLLVWDVALTHTRTSELPGWLAGRLGHE